MSASEGDNNNNIAKLGAIYQQALQLHEDGRIAQALPLYEQVLQRLSDADLVHYNYALARYEVDDFSGAVRSFERAAELQPDEPDYWFNLGLAAKKSGDYQKSQRSYEKALALRPDDADLHYNLACCLQAAENYEAAINAYEQTLALEPGNTSALGNLAYLLHRQGDLEGAGKKYESLLQLQPQHSGARHMLAALRGVTSDRAPQHYVEALFDNYSSSFDASLLDTLEYQVPELLAQMLRSHNGKKNFASCLDLGCGTGLAGEKLKKRCNVLTGIDLSKGMIDEAHKKNIYDELLLAEAVSFLENSRQRYDLILAADVLTYLGDLQPLFKACARCARQQALFSFSTEHSNQEDWQLKPSGRYGHERDYVVEAAGKYGWRKIRYMAADLRKERHAWIKGDIFLLEFAG